MVFSSLAISGGEAKSPQRITGVVAAVPGGRSDPSICRGRGKRGVRVLSRAKRSREEHRERETSCLRRVVRELTMD
jgi:hypothetical protein